MGSSGPWVAVKAPAEPKAALERQTPDGLSCEPTKLFPQRRNQPQNVGSILQGVWVTPKCSRAGWVKAPILQMRRGGPGARKRGGHRVQPWGHLPGQAHGGCCRTPGSGGRAPAGSAGAVPAAVRSANP